MDSYFVTPFTTDQTRYQSNRTLELTSLRIRQAKQEDLNGLTDVLLKSFHPNSTWLHPIFRLGVYEDVKSRLNCKLSYYSCLIASDPSCDQVVGTIELTLRPISLLGKCLPYISNLAVSTDCRRQGVALKLLERCEQIVAHWGFREIWLHVLEDNLTAQHLYRKKGYTTFKIETDLGNLIFKKPKKILLLKKL